MLRIDGARGRLAGGIVLAVVAGAVAGIAKWPHAWPWLLAVAAGVGAAAASLGLTWSDGRQRRATAARVIRAQTQGTQGRQPGRLPLVREVDLDALRVHTAVHDMPYVRRTAEKDLRDLIVSGRPALLVGSSMVGKTRLAAETVRELRGDWPILIPDSKAALTQLDSADVPIVRTVVWLDDIDRLIGADGVTAGTLRRLNDAGNLIVATIRARQFDQYRPGDEIRPPEWDALALFGRVYLDRNLDSDEEQRLRDAVDDEVVRNRIRMNGIGEYVGAAEQIADQLRLGPSANPLGYAILVGAVDWYRTGMIRPVPGALLTDLARPHLPERRRSELGDPQRVEAAIRWATREINPTVSQLEPDGQGGYSVFDYTRDEITRRSEPIPAETWNRVAQAAEPEELLALAARAWSAGAQDSAEKAWTDAIPTGKTDVLFNLGYLFAARGDTERAEIYYRQAIDAGDTGALLNLGVLLADRGDSAQAEIYYRQAIDTGNHMALLNLGNLLTARGDNEQAEIYFRLAIDAGDPKGPNNLGVLLANRGDSAQAETYYRLAIDAGDVRAMRNLGNLIADRGDSAEAETYFHQAIDAGHTAALINLGNLLADRGDSAEAETYYHQAIDAGHTAALNNLGILLASGGHSGRAESYYHQAIDAGHTNALRNLGNLLVKRGDSAQAETYYRRAIDAGDTRALNNLGAVLADRGDIEQAEAYYRRAIAAGHTAALNNLAALLADRGSSERAETE